MCNYVPLPYLDEDGRTTAKHWFSWYFYVKICLLSMNETKIPKHLDCGRSISAYLRLMADKTIPDLAEPHLELSYSPFVAGIDLPHQGGVDSYNVHKGNPYTDWNTHYKDETVQLIFIMGISILVRWHLYIELYQCQNSNYKDEGPENSYTGKILFSYWISPLVCTASLIYEC